MTRLELRAAGESQPDPYGGFIQQQIVIQLKQADANGDGVIDEAEGKNNRAFRGLFKFVDRDRDGKVTEKELTDYLDKARDLQDAGGGGMRVAGPDQSEPRPVRPARR